MFSVLISYPFSVFSRLKLSSILRIMIFFVSLFHFVFIFLLKSTFEACERRIQNKKKKIWIWKKKKEGIWILQIRAQTIEREYRLGRPSTSIAIIQMAPLNKCWLLWFPVQWDWFNANFISFEYIFFFAIVVARCIDCRFGVNFFFFFFATQCCHKGRKKQCYADAWTNSDTNR